MSMQKEEFVPLKEGEVTVYVCGPTTYNLVHIGNARTFTSFDMVVRYLRYRGFQVTYVRNFTDVDDKIINAAAKTGEPAIALSARFVAEFQSDTRRLQLLEPDFAPKVSEHIPQIVSLIERLIARRVAYESQGDVYFAVNAYPAYAKLSKRNLEELRQGERVLPGEQKREPLDFALWKSAKPGEPAWDSPWGKGRPGWHIECSAMSASYLGETFDIHGGGRDLIFPHHENEIAQSEAVFQKTYARYWMHGGMLEMKNAKMSKSLGNVVMLRDALDRMDAEALRLFLLSTHYRNPLEFSEQSLSDADQGMEYFYETLRKVDERLAGKEPPPGALHGDPSSFLRGFEASMDDDFNVPGARSSLSAAFGMMNELADKPAIRDKAMVARTLRQLRQDVASMGRAIGILGDDPHQWLLRRRERAAKQRGLDQQKVQQLIEQRLQARSAKDFAAADRIRDELRTMGVELMDTAAGPVWKVLP